MLATIVRVFNLLFLIAIPVTCAYAQSLSIENLQNQISALSPDNPADQPLRELFQSALTELQSAEQLRTQLDQFQKLQETLPTDLARARDQLQRPLPASRNVAANNEIELNRQITTAQQRLREEENRRDTLRQQLTVLQGRMAAWPNEMQTLQRTKTELQQRRVSLESGTGPLNNARLTALLARQQVIALQEQVLEAERLNHDLRVSLVTAEQNLANRLIEQLQNEVRQLQATQNTRQREAATAALEQTTQAIHNAIERPSFIQELINFNNQLGNELRNVTQQQERIEQNQLELNDQLNALELRIQRVQEQVNIGGFNPALGPILLAEHQSLPNVSAYQRDARTRQQDIVTARLAQHRVDNVLSNWREIRQQHVTNPQLNTLPIEQQREVRQQLTQLLNDQQNLYERLQAGYSNLINQWVLLDQSQLRLIGLAAQHRQHLDYRLLWLPTGPRIDQAWARASIPELSKLLELPEWDLSPSFLWMLVLWLFWLLLGRFWKYRLKWLSEPIGKVGRDKLQYTFRALLVTAVMALPFPVLIGFTIQEFSLALIIFILLFIEKLFVPKGVAISHFHWPSKLSLPVRLTATVLAVSWIIVYLLEKNASRWGDFGNVIYQTMQMFLQLGMALVLFVILWKITQKQWQKLVGTFLLLPLFGLSALSALGYSYSVNQISDRLFQTFALLLVGILFLQLILRSFSISARRIVFQRALARREARQKEEETAIEMMPDLSIQDINEQVRSLLVLVMGLGFLAGLWPIWGNLMPALGEIAVISQLDGQFTLTLGNLALSIGILILIPLVNANLPGTLEILFARLDSGSRYALVAILRYAIISGGIIFALDRLGLPWSQLQWLVAALGVGLGFGLQEIFANFVSGLILLIERPLRVGDTITVNDFHGTVSKIRIRATTIVDWDNKEIVVPNRALITGTLINWTLTNNITRIIIGIRIPYQCDPKQVHGIIEQVVQENASILTDPAAAVWLRRFGDYSVEFEVFAYVAEIGHRLSTIHSLHVDLWQRLQESGLSVPLPQLDVHLVEKNTEILSS